MAWMFVNCSHRLVGLNQTCSIWAILFFGCFVFVLRIKNGGEHEENGDWDTVIDYLKNWCSYVSLLINISKIVIVLRNSIMSLLSILVMFCWYKLSLINWLTYDKYQHISSPICLISLCWWIVMYFVKHRTCTHVYYHICCPHGRYNFAYTCTLIGLLSTCTQKW